MIKYKKKVVEEFVFDEFVCDYCGRKLSEGDLDLQEVHSITFVGGYSSIFGDGIKVSCDLCQECLRDRIGDIFRYE